MVPVVALPSAHPVLMGACPAASLSHPVESGIMTVVGEVLSSFLRTQRDHVGAMCQGSHLRGRYHGQWEEVAPGKDGTPLPEGWGACLQHFSAEAFPHRGASTDGHSTRRAVLTTPSRA